MDRQSIKWRGAQWDFQNNGSKYESERAQKRDNKKKHTNLRTKVKDKVWFDSLTYEEKNTLLQYWYFIYLDREDCEVLCKRKIPGSKNTQRDIKIDILLR